MVSGREKGCYFAGGNQNRVRMKKSGNRPRECPGTPQQARASSICPAGRILFSNENGKLCAAALEMNFVPHHHLAPSMWHSPPESGMLTGRAVGIRRFQTMFHLKFYRMMDNQKKYAGNHGRKPKPDKMRHRYVFRLDDGDNARFSRFSTSRARRPRRSLSFPHFSARRLRLLNWIRGRRISTCA